MTINATNINNGIERSISFKRDYNYSVIPSANTTNAYIFNVVKSFNALIIISIILMLNTTFCLHFCTVG